MHYFASQALLLAACAAGVVADTRPPKIDTHVHFVPDFYSDALKAAGHLPGPDGMPGIPTWTAEDHLTFMNAQNITKSYLSISSPGVYIRVPSKAATAEAIDLARRTNEFAAGVKAKYPDRFGYFASLPLPDINAALAELDYVFGKLKPAPDGVVFMSNFYGLYFGDPELDPVYAKLNALNVTIFEHPTTPCTEFNHYQYTINSTNTPNISAAAWQAMNRPVASRVHPAPQLDFPYESARTFSDLISSQVPSRFPNVRWIVPHGGGALVTVLDRIILTLPFYTTLNVTTASLQKTLSKSFYFDLAGPWPVTAAIPALLRWVDYTHILWGSDTPWTTWAGAATYAAAFDKDVDTVFSDYGGAAKAQSIRDGNAKSLFGWRK